MPITSAITGLFEDPTNMESIPKLNIFYKLRTFWIVILLDYKKVS